jgi:hypothetical protein
MILFLVVKETGS